MRKLRGALSRALRSCRVMRRALVAISMVIVLTGSVCWAEPITIRVRLAWGSGDNAKHRWTGKISCDGATFSDFQPLGIEADAAVANRLLDNQLVIQPWDKRGFDGCDITVEGSETSTMRFELQSDQTSEPTVVEIPLARLVKEQIREPIDSLGSFLLAYRCPGDRFRVMPNRKNLVFRPGEIWPLRLETDFDEELAAGPLVVEVAMRRIGAEEVLWQSTQVLKSSSVAVDQLAFEVVCPNVEGAYRLSLSARSEQSFATRFVPGQGSKPFATREIDLVVIDPAAKLPTLANHWLPVLSIDPANPSWWQRLPTWAQVSRLTGKPLASIGNVRLLARESDPNGWVDLPPSASEQDPAWQAFTLPVLEVGVPHRVEISYPRAERQNLGVSIVEPDAAGRVTSTVLEAGFTIDDPAATENDKGAHQIVFWPKTRSPQLLIVNHSTNRPAVFGQITLSRHDGATSSLAQRPADNGSTRLVAGYIGKPVFAQNMGAAEVLDPASGMSVQSWSTFLDGAQRLSQHLKLSGFNGVLVSVVADGSALYPSEILQPSPRYDSGVLAASGQDPERKDVLEMLLRVCDREQVRIVPTVQLMSPLPRLEAKGVRRTSDNTQVSWISPNRSGANVSGGRGSQYNLLEPSVHREVTAVVMELVNRYSEHLSMAGIALQIDSRGYGMLPDGWSVTREELEAFATETEIELAPTEMDVNTLSEEHRRAWQNWRAKKLTQFYAGLVKQVQEKQPKLRLILTTDNLLADPVLEQAVRRNLSQPARVEELLAQRGIDLKQLSMIPGLEVADTCWLTSKDHFQRTIADTALNELMLRNQTASGSAKTSLFMQGTNLLRLSSFDQLSPFGADRTYLILTSQSDSADSTTHRSLVSELVEGRFQSVIAGGDYLPIAYDPVQAQYLQAIEQLPSTCQDVRTLDEQPVAVHVERTANATYLVGINESPWPMEGTVQLESSNGSVWRDLAAEKSDTQDRTSGVGKISKGRGTWPLAMKGYEVRVWKFDEPQLRADNLQVQANSGVREYLQQRIQDMENRAGNLNITRDYPQLQNPGFELNDASSRIFGWQPTSGNVDLETASVHNGSLALRLTSAKEIPVVVQSHLFPIPATGMLVVGAQIKAEQIASDAQFAVVIETEDEGRTFRRVQKFDSLQLTNQWTPIELAVNDLPVGSAAQLRVLFQIAGAANVVLDDVTLCDLRFDDYRRSELVKRVFAARTALEEDQVVDCLRLVNEYWSRYLVEYVPPLEREPALAKQPTEEETSESKSKVGGRLRGWVPRIWR